MNIFMKYDVVCENGTAFRICKFRHARGKEDTRVLGMNKMSSKDMTGF